MDFSENYNELLVQMNVNMDTGKLKHNINKNTPLLPFKSREPERAIFDNGFYKELGEFSRILLNKVWVGDLESNRIISTIIQKDIDIEDGTDEYLIKLLKEYLFNEKNELKLLDPYLFLYIPLSKNKRANGEKEIALFLRDIFCKNNQNLTDFFANDGSNHVIINLLLENIDEIEREKRKVLLEDLRKKGKTSDDLKINEKFVPFLDEIIEIFNEDINFAIKNEKFLVDNMDNIFAYYYFFYISQLILKISKGFYDDGELESLYFLLDWENASKNRKSLNKGYHFLKDKTSYLFTKMTLIDQLNTLIGQYGLLEKDILEYYNGLDNESKGNLLFYLKKWVGLYRSIRKFEYMDLPNDFEELIVVLFNSLNDENNGIDPAPKSRYAKNLEEISKKYFLKRRGSHGYVLNINRDMLLVITALCVKDRKLKLKHLFEEYEKRGIYFDRYSKEEVVNFLTKLNLIDKKSDSGDAQYVKPVL